MGERADENYNLYLVETYNELLLLLPWDLLSVLLSAAAAASGPKDGVTVNNNTITTAVMRGVVGGKGNAARWWCVFS